MFKRRTIVQRDEEPSYPESFLNESAESPISGLLFSLPLLAHRVVNETHRSISAFLDFVVPKFPQQRLPEFWHDHSNNSFAEFMLRHFDANRDGHISSSELLNVTDFFSKRFHHPHPDTWWIWFSRAWPLTDWKLGMFLWNTFGGVLFLLAVFSIIPGRLHGISAKILRWPLLGLTYFLVTVELGVYTVIRIGIRVAEYLIAVPKHRGLRQKMAQATSYEEWYKAALQLDKSQKRERWLKQVDDETSYRYNWGFIQELMRDMRSARAKGDSLLALAVIQQCTRKNVGGVMSEELFSFSNTGEPKAIVRQFINEVVETLHWITDEAHRVGVQPVEGADDIVKYEERFQHKVRAEKDKLFGSLIDATLHVVTNGRISSKSSGSSHSSGEKEDIVIGNESSKRSLSACHQEHLLLFLKRARAAYGRTALCLSGGAMMGLYHFGVVKALLEAGILPHIISGTSAGSVVGAIVCTRTDDELLADLTPEVLDGKLCCFRRPWKERIKGIMNDGNMFAFEDWMELIQWFTRGQTTFLEAYRLTGRIFCITLSSTTKKAPPVLLNYLTAPNVTIASAVVASAAVPGFIPPVRLQVKDENGVVRNQGGEKDPTYFDGSIQADLPTQGLAEILNCQFFIASQCNPHVVPFFFNAKGGVGRPSRWSSGMQEDSWRGGFLLAALEMYLKNDMKAKMKFLNDMEAAVGFTSTMLVQEFIGSTTMVPQVRFRDFFRLFSDPRAEELPRYFQVGAVAAYEHIEMIKLHYSIANAIDECISKLEGDRRLTLITMKNFRSNAECDTSSVRTTDSEGEEEYESLWFDGTKPSDNT